MNEIEEILHKYNFSHKFYVKYALVCAKYAISFDKKPHPDSLKAIDLVDRWLQGEPITDDALLHAARATAAANDASYAARAASYAAYYAAHAAHAASAAYYAAANAAYYAANAANAANAAYYAAHAAAYAAPRAAAYAASNSEDYKPCHQLLLNMIKTDLSQFERDLIGAV